MKKKVIYTVLGCCFVVAAVIFVASSMKDGKDRAAAGLSRMTNQNSDQPVGMVNPMVEVTDNTQFGQIGVVLNEPENAEDVKRYIVGNSFAEIICKVNKQEFTLRAQKGADGQSLSGLYGDFIASNRMSEAEYYMVDTGKKYYVAIWEKDGVTYVVTTASSEEQLAEIVEEMLK